MQHGAGAKHIYKLVEENRRPRNKHVKLQQPDI